MNGKEHYAKGEELLSLALREHYPDQKATYLTAATAHFAAASAWVALNGAAGHVSQPSEVTPRQV